MDLPVLALLLLAAAAHAGWNAWIKDAGASLPQMATVAIGWLVVAIIALPFAGLPSLANVPYLLATTVVHTLYAIVLISAYRHGEFSLTYPLARGAGPLFVSLSAPYLLQEHLEGPSLFAVTLIVVGIFMIGAFRSVRGVHDHRAILLSLATGVLIAAYTMIDATGARAGASPHAYAAWLFLLTAIALLATTAMVHKENVAALVFSRWRSGIPVGVLSAAAYWVVIWAMTVAPTALVAAVRETSILFAALFGWGFLGEKIRFWRWVGAGITVIGLVLAKL